MKIRLTQSCRDALNNARRVFGVEDNDNSAICRRALRSYKSKAFDYSKCNDKTIGNPVTINAVSDLPAKEFQGLVIAYVNIQIEKNASRRQSALVIDGCDNYIINGE